MTAVDDAASLRAKVEQLKADDPELAAAIRAEQPSWPRGRGGHRKWLREIHARTPRFEETEKAPERGE